MKTKTFLLLNFKLIQQNTHSHQSDLHQYFNLSLKVGAGGKFHQRRSSQFNPFDDMLLNPIIFQHEKAKNWQNFSLGKNSWNDKVSAGGTFRKTNN